MSDAVEAQDAPVRDLITCPARWSPEEKGYIEVRHPTTGEVAEIPYEHATEVWKEDIRRIGRARRARGGRAR
jgi:hypothetical protein